MSKPAHKIKAATAIAPFVLRIEWANGRINDVDLSDTIKSVDFFAGLNDADLFMQAHAGEWGWDVVWPGNVDMAADRLLILALEQSGKVENARFREWLSHNRLTLDEAAKAIGLTSRTINQYGTGSRPVPRYITLACKGWEAERRDRHA
jgi:DNA-binding XRE family transcriptional regulator